MQFRAAVAGQLHEFMAMEAGIVIEGSTEAVAKRVLGTKLAVRAIINASFTGSGVVGRKGNRRVANAIRGQLFSEDPDGKGRPALLGIVYSRFGRRQLNGSRGDRFNDYLLPHVLGSTITPSNARMLYIPLVPNMRGPLGRRARVSFKLDPTVEVIPSGTKGVFVVVRRRRGKNADAPGTALGLLVSRVKLPKRFSIDSVVAAIPDQLAADVLREMQMRDSDRRYENYQLSTRTDGRGGAGKRRGRRGRDI